MSLERDGSKRSDQRPLWILLPLAAAGLIYLAFANAGFYGGADEVVHYWMSRYSWQHPLLFLDLWGKPLFTAVTSPFAQLGLEWLRLHNVLAGLAAAFMAFRILGEAGVRHAWLGFGLTIGAPAYFALMPSALTEVPFSLVLMLGVWGLLRGRYRWAAFLLSFLPFVRNEGVVILLALLPWLLRRRQLAAALLLASGCLLFSLLGWGVFGDLLWLWHRNPYGKGNPMYGSGELLHFVKEIPRSTGLVISLSAVAAWILALLPRKFLDRAGLRPGPWLTLSFLGSAPYFAAHSWAWWAGAGGSLGLSRVMGAVSPLLSLPAAWLISALLGRLPRSWMQYLAAAILLGAVVSVPVRQHRPPGKPDDLHRLTLEAAQWLNGSEYAGRRLYYYDPIFLFYAGRDPYDMGKVQERLPDTDAPGSGVPAGSIVAWDAHFGNNEGHLPRERLLADPGFRLLRTFAPANTIRVLNGFPYEILILERVSGE